MAATNVILDEIPDKKRGVGAIICMIEKKIWLRENLLALPMEYL